MITYTYDLDVTPGGVPLSVHASQYDGDSRTFVFRLFSSAGELSLPSAAEASVKGTKPDGNGFSYTAERSGNNVTVQLTKQMTAVAGHVRCEIVINLGETELATANFILVVERAALDKDTLISGSEIREIIEITDRTDEILAAARSMEQSAASVETNARSAAASAQSASESKQSAAQSLTSVQQKAREIAAIKTEADLTAAQALEKATNAENEVAENQNTLDALQRNDEAMQLLIEGKIDGAYVESGYLYLTSNDEIVAGPLGPFSGGGGGGGGEGGNNAQITVTNAAGWLSKTVASDEDVTIVVNWSSIEDDMPTGNGSMKITVNGAVKAILEVAQGEVRTEISSYLTVGSNVVKVNVSDMYGNNRTVNYSVTVVALSVSSPFDDTAAYTGPISFGYVPVGNVQKTVHFILDGDEIGSTVTSVSGRQQSFTIPQQTHGPHTFSCYFDAVINGQTVRSNELYYEIICLEVLNDTPIIVSDYHETTVKQYASMHIGYSVYDPTSMTADVVIMGDLASKVTAQLGGGTTTENPAKTTGLQATTLKNLSEGDVIKKVGALFTADQKRSGILASVSLAQFILESGYGKTELAQNANNVFGMKKTLSGNTWSGSTWDGKSIYTKKTQEDDGTGRIYTITADFRKYPCIEESIGDHSAYLLGAKNGSKLRYEGLKGCTNYKKAIQIIKDGGYATDTSYVIKICSIIERWNLTQYDVKSESAPATKPIADRTIHDITKENLSQVPRSRGSNKIQFIVVHYLGVPNADNPNLYGGGYGGHYNIKRDGSIYKAADPKTAVVWHCGGGLQGSGGHSFYQICTNFNSIGIECGVCYTENVKEASGDSDKWYFTTETQESLVWLVSRLMDEYGIGADHVIRHYDVTGKICPNPYVKNNRLKTSWTWDEFKARLADYRKTGGTSAATEPEKWYRVRKSWSDASSQIGAYKVLDNAKAAADEHPGYTVYDCNGKAVYAPAAKSDVPFLVRVDIDDLNIRTGPGTDHQKTGKYTGKGVFTIVEVKPGKGSSAGWGRLKSGAGWIALIYAKRI